VSSEPVSPTHARDLEPAISERGRALLAAVEPERLIALSPAWWQDRLMEWATDDPEFRVKLLRFVDVLPALRSSRAIADHVRQYFRDDAPAAVRLGSAIGRRKIFRPVLSRVVRQGVFAMAERFIGGASPAAALPRLRELVEDGTAYTIDLLGEATLSEAEADGYRDRYFEVFQVLGKSRGWDAPSDVRQPNVSIKLSALTSHFEPAAPGATYAALRGRLLPILECAREAGAFVNINMEQYRYKDLTHTVLEQLVREEGVARWPDLGIVVQAYLRDAGDDIARIEGIARERGAPITVRLVKGAYWDEETILAQQQSHPVPVFEEKAATDANYERCSGLLVEAYPHLRPAFASHNPRSLAQAIAVAEEARIPRAEVEFQMLYGMAEGLRRAVQAQGYRTRVYVPAGEILPGMAYLVRRLLENTSNESWLVNKHEHGDAAEALRPPAPAPPATPARRRRFRNHPPPPTGVAPSRRAQRHGPGDRAGARIVRGRSPPPHRRRGRRVGRVARGASAGDALRPHGPRRRSQGGARGPCGSGGASGLSRLAGHIGASPRPRPPASGEADGRAPLRARRDDGLRKRQALA